MLPIDIPLEGAFDAEQVGAYIMGCAWRPELTVRVDYQDGSTFTPADDQPASSTASTSSLARHESAVHPSTAELVRTRLSKVSMCLLGVIEEQPPAPSAEMRAAKFQALIAGVESELKAL